MGKVTFTERVGEISTTYEFESYEDFKDWENKLSGVVVSTDEMFVESDGWIENKGYMPVEEGTLVDVKHLDGETYFKVTAGQGAATDWDLYGRAGQITHYRLVDK